MRYIKNYNAKNYKVYNFRFRQGSELCKQIENYKATGNSLCFLISKLLCDHFEIPLPHKWYFSVKTEIMYSQGEADEIQHN
jgi:hypothetical protein